MNNEAIFDMRTSILVKIDRQCTSLLFVGCLLKKCMCFYVIFCTAQSMYDNIFLAM